MAQLSIDTIKRQARKAVDAYNTQVPPARQILQVSLFGSYAEGRATEESDVDLLVRFATPAVSLFALARALETFQQHVDASVDLIQDPLPEDSLLIIGEKVPIYD